MAAPRLAVLDLGTNTFRLLIAEPSPGSLGGFNPLFWERVITRAGGGFSSEGISAQALDRILACLRRFRARVAEFGVSTIRAAGTSVFRRASNRLAVLETIRVETGFEIDVIDGEEEAELSARGALSQLGATGSATVFDIGGGSTEYVVWSDGGVRHRESLEFGVVRLAEEVFVTDPPLPADLARADTWVTPLIQSAAMHARSVLGKHPFALVGTAGTVSTLAAVDLALAQYDRWRIHGHRLTRPFVAASFARFAACDRAGRSVVVGVEPGREDLLVPGCLIALRSLEAFDASEIVVSEGGLLEGLMEQLVQTRYA